MDRVTSYDAQGQIRILTGIKGLGIQLSNFGSLRYGYGYDWLIYLFRKKHI